MDACVFLSIRLCVDSERSSYEPPIAISTHMAMTECQQINKTKYFVIQLWSRYFVNAFSSSSSSFSFLFYFVLFDFFCKTTCIRAYSILLAIIFFVIIIVEIVKAIHKRAFKAHNLITNIFRINCTCILHACTL